MKEQSKTEQYIEKVIKHVRGRAAKKGVAQELQDHIKQKIEHLVEERGIGYEHAETLALEEMGSAKEISKKINRINGGAWHVICKYIMAGITLMAGFFVIQSAMYPTVTLPVRTVVVGDTAYASVIGGTGVHPPSPVLSLLFIVAVFLTVGLFVYSARTITRTYMGV